jgi:stage V sporulation protein G
MLNITEVRIHLIPANTTNLRAYASITIDGCFVVHGLRILDGDHGLFVGMPRRKRGAAPNQDIAHPINTDTRRMIETMILDRYAETIAQGE